MLASVKVLQAIKVICRCESLPDSGASAGRHYSARPLSLLRSSCRPKGLYPLTTALGWG